MASEIPSPSLAGEKPVEKKDKKKKEKDSTDVVCPVGFTLLCKCIEETEPDKLFLVGTMIYRVINPYPGFEKFDLRINERSPGDDQVEVRRGRPVEFVGAEDEKISGVCVTNQVKLPLILEQEEGISYPFKIMKAKVKIEFSTPAVDGIQYRPSIMEVIGEENTRELICLKHHVKKGANKDDPPQVTYDHEAFDQSFGYDTVTAAPDWKIEPENKGKIIYYPKIELEWQITSPYLKALVSTMVPVLLLLGLQWINWYITIAQPIGGGDPDTATYLTNAITLILALVVIVPQIQGSNSSLRSTMGTVEYLVFFFFLGTGLASYPEFWAALAGLVITTGSMLFPVSGVGAYFRRIYEIETSKVALEHWLPKPGSKAKGEVVDFSKLKVRPWIAENKDAPLSEAPVSTSQALHRKSHEHAKH